MIVEERKERPHERRLEGIDRFDLRGAEHVHPGESWRAVVAHWESSIVYAVEGIGRKVRMRRAGVDDRRMVGCVRAERRWLWCGCKRGE